MHIGAPKFHNPQLIVMSYSFDNLLTKANFMTHSWFAPQLHQIGSFLSSRTFFSWILNVMPLWFQLSNEVAAHNEQILQSVDYDLYALIQLHPNSIISFRSESRPTDSFHILLMHHLRWLRLQNILNKGSKWLTENFDDETCITKNNELVAKENH